MLMPFSTTFRPEHESSLRQLLRWRRFGNETGQQYESKVVCAHQQCQRFRSYSTVSLDQSTYQLFRFLQCVWGKGVVRLLLFRLGRLLSIEVESIP